MLETVFDPPWTSTIDCVSSMNELTKKFTQYLSTLDRQNHVKHKLTKKYKTGGKRLQTRP